MASLTACGVLVAGCLAKVSAPRPELRALQITEVHYHPLGTATVNSDEYEFVELKNTGDQPLNLDAVGFTHGIDFAFSATATVDAGAFLVVVASATAFSERYGFAPTGVYGGRLSNTGERITLSDLRDDAVLAGASYLDRSPWPVAADGGGRSLVPVTTWLTDDPHVPAHWRTSFALHGSPGRDDPDMVYINEILVHTDPPQIDSIELFNPNDTPFNVSGWFLTDQKANPTKFRIPEGTVMAAGGYKVFTADDFNGDPKAPSSFSLSEHGEDVYLFADRAGCGTAFCDGFAFGDMENGVAFGRHVTSAGEVHLVSLRTPTLGAKNADPAVGPLVITELMYNPPNGRDEYIELQNTGTQFLPLSEPSRAEHTWRLEGAGFAFPPGIMLAPGEVVLILSSAAAQGEFRLQYGVPDAVRIFKKDQDLPDYGGQVTLMKAWKPYAATAGQLILPFIVQETVDYSNTLPWPAAANGTGAALHRKTGNGYANDPQNWEASIPTPGRLP